nr:pyridoxal phosphate-dependent aminotransferase [Bradyrhizobium zhengyangense]
MNTRSRSKRVGKIQVDVSESMAQKAKLRVASGKRVISLAQGEPDFDTPEHVQEAAIAAIRAGETRYTINTGTIQLREAISRKLRRDNDLEYGVNQIVVAPGAKPSIYNAFAATLNDGDEVIIPAPYWVPMPDMVRLAGGQPVIVACGVESDFKMQPGQLQAAITPRTRWLLLNSPNNPSGSIYSKAELLSFAEILRRHPNVLALSDDIYEHIRFDGRPFYTLAQIAPDLRERILTVNGVSKAYAMTGWRIGYCAGPDWLIRDITRVLSQATGGACSIAQAAALAALEGPQDFLAQRVAVFHRRRDFVLPIIKAIPGLSAERPEGGFYIFVSCTDLIGKTTPAGGRISSDSVLCDYLLAEADIAVVQGAAYGLSPYFRISIASSDDDLRTAVAAIRSAVLALR